MTTAADIDALPDDIDLLEERFAALARAAVVAAYITFDPGSPEPQKLPALKLRRDAEAYPQIYEHVLAQSGGTSGVYLVKLREGGTYRHTVRLNLLFRGPTTGSTGGLGLVSPQVSPQAPQVSPPVSPRLEDDLARTIGDRLVRQAVEDLINPPAEDDQDDDEDEDDDEEEEEADETPLTGLAGVLREFFKGDDAKAVVGDFFSSMADERRARAKKLNAEADAIAARGGTPTAPTQTRQERKEPTRGGLGGVVQLRVLDDERAADAG